MSLRAKELFTQIKQAHHLQDRVFSGLLGALLNYGSRKRYRSL